MKVLFLQLVILWNQTLFAQDIQNFEISPSDRLQVKCFNGKFQMVEEGKGSGLVVSTKMLRGRESYSGNSIRVEKKEGVIQIECSLSKSDLEKLIIPENQNEGVLPGFEIFVRGQSIPAEVNWKSGEVLVKGWKKNSHIVLEKGKLQVRESHGDFNLNMIEGQMSVLAHKGRLQIESYDSKILVDGLEGPINVTNFIGLLKLVKVNGDIKLSSRKGQILVSDSEGGLKFENDLGKTEIAKFKGAIDGLSDQGITEVRLLDPVQLKLKSKTGQLDIVAPRSSGARVDMVIGDGQYRVPNNLKTEYLSNVRTVRGELQGAQKGQITVRAETAKVTLRTN